MSRPVIDSRMYAKLDHQFFTSRARIEAPTTTADSYGTPTTTWATVSRLQGLPCYVAPGGGTEVRGGLLVLVTDLRTVQFSGYYPEIDQGMRAVVDGTAFDIVAVEHDSQQVSTRLRVRVVST